ncbi:MAG: bifunctional 4-hydroxy-2-oxoglutarate aldolase/2-dehydro-3-deoxy-phosphogluconate aldolase [Halobellus sp.]
MRSQRHADLERIRETGIVGILRGVPEAKTIDVVEALAAGGVDAVEVTADTDGALETIARLRDVFDRSEVLVGAGTVLDGETAVAALRAGAEFVVTPSFDPEVVEACNRYGAVVAPGVMTPTEALDAYEAGADLLKIFPASTLGPGHVRSIRGPLDQLPLVPTGGVGLDNVGDFIEAGAAGVGVGSSLVDADAVAAEDYAALRGRAESFREAIERARSE